MPKTGNIHQQGTSLRSGKPIETDFCQFCNCWRGSLGLEPTPELFVQHIVEIFRECRRVLRDDGVCAINFGDSYSSGGGDQVLQTKNASHGLEGMRQKTPNMAPKQLLAIPWRVALALQADGWWLRSAMPWVKRSAMPSSTKDRPANALEYMFMLTKSQHCYFDMEAIKIKSSPDTHRRYNRGRSDSHKYSDGGPGNQTIAKTFNGMKVPPKAAPAGSGIKANESFEAATNEIIGTRNFRNTDLFYQSIEPPHGLIWAENENSDGEVDIELLGLDVNPKGMKESHFATFPPKLISPLILAGSPVMCCPDCGTGWERVVDYKANYTKREPAHQPGNTPSKVDSTGWKPPTIKQKGFRPSCSCYDGLYQSTIDFPESHNPRKRSQRSISGDHYTRSRRRPGCSDWKTVPAMVCDIFGGSGTVGLVSQEHGRNFTLIELSKTYIDDILIPRITDGAGFSLRNKERFSGGIKRFESREDDNQEQLGLF